jgi:hypothetical protein
MPHQVGAGTKGPKKGFRQGKYRVRCLGPGPEHTFLSQGPWQRICGQCKRAGSVELSRLELKVRRVITNDRTHSGDG